ncbi:relaxase domain-containing protein [Kordia sp. TARA_039_SRF]|nr:relaxase domain-containing protein [Kordia sp. TARA_039_SRF]
MIRMHQSSNIVQTKTYFASSLSKADYYIEGQESSGHFYGKIAERLDLKDKPIIKSTFDLLCDNINPQTGQALTPRTFEYRRVGYDISFHCPKSVSILYGLSLDKTILKAFQTCVYETMLEIETATQTRIRKHGKNDDRVTGEMIWCDFTHLTARPVDNYAPDCHIHQHIFVFNTTYDEVEQRFKAGQFYQIKKDMPYYQARFLKRLADRYSKLGYGIRKTSNGFELSVVPKNAIALFSKRTNLIGEVAKSKNITNAKALDQLGAQTRQRKNNTLTLLQLREQWQDQLTEYGIDDEPEEQPTQNLDLNAHKTVNFAIEKSFTRNSVRRETQILTHAYYHAIDNKDVTLSAIDEKFANNTKLFKVKSGGQYLYTSHKVHDEEKQMIDSARRGIGKYSAFDERFDETLELHLGDEQQKALKHIMRSKDFLTMVRGGAGTGKTTLFKTLIPFIEYQGFKVSIFAPTATASRDVLRHEGFEYADTVFQLLNNETIQNDIQGQVILIDEAGMLGAQDAKLILELAEEQQARVIFVGDPRQHSAVQRGDAMRILQTIGQIPYVSLNEIFRQKQETYKQAVYAISQGNIEQGFTQLDENNAIIELPIDKISQSLISDYIDLKGQKKSVLVISPTRNHVRELNLGIREKLKTLNYIGKRQKNFTTYQSLYLTDVDKQDGRHYQKGFIIQAHQNLKNIKRGSVLQIVDNNQGRVIVTDIQGNNHELPLNKTRYFDLYRPYPIDLSRGDEIRITKNSYDMKGKRLDNGTVLKVVGFTKDGHIKTAKETSHKASPILLNKRHGNFDYAYANTSYSAQGKTVDHVLINQPITTLNASNQKQFYVSVSRGREAVTIYTDDKQELLNSIKQSGDRIGALELIG